MKNFWGFLLLVFLIAIILRVDLFFYVFYLFAVLAVATHWWTRRALRGVTVQRVYEDRAFLGEGVDVTLTVRNQGRLPVPWLRIQEGVPIEMASPPFVRRVVSLWPGESATLRYSLDCRRRGYYRLGPTSLGAGDVFGFGEDQTREGNESFLTVYPKIVPLERLGLPSRSPSVSLPSRQRLFEDPSRVRGVRPYQSGDSPRRIHWTASAATGELLLKQYEPAIALETMVLLDLAEDDYAIHRRYNASEVAVTVAASILSHLAGIQQAVGLAVDGYDPLSAGMPMTLPPGKGQAHLIQTLDILARVELGKAEPIVEWARRVTAGLGWGSTVVLVLPAEPPDLAPLLLHLQRAGFSIVLVLTQGTPSGAAQRLGIPVTQVYWETEVPELAHLGGV
ncbi:MAG: DUF58 domain-containing protein [Anaerolineae bacterium]